MKRTRMVIAFLCCAVLPTATTRSSSLTLERTLPASSLMSASTVVVASSRSDNIETKYDGFAHETTVTLKKMRITCGGAKWGAFSDACVSFEVSLHCPGVQLDYIRYAKLQLIFETKDWHSRHPLDERELIVVVDDEQLKLGKMSLVKQDLGTVKAVDVMREVLEVSFPYETFKKLAAAETVEVKVGKSRFGLSPKNLVALRDLNNRVKLPPRVAA